MQQYLPFTVLKHYKTKVNKLYNPDVATVLTVYGIETKYGDVYSGSAKELQQYLPFTVLKQDKINGFKKSEYTDVATVLTVYGIETAPFVCTMVVAYYNGCNSTYRLRY